MMYYPISSGAMNLSPKAAVSEFCVGLALGIVHTRQNITWVDAGAPVLCVSPSQANDGAPHAIDPSVIKSEDGH